MKNGKTEIMIAKEKELQELREKVLEIIHNTEDPLLLYEIYLLILDAFALEHGEGKEK